MKEEQAPQETQEEAAPPATDPEPAATPEPHESTTPTDDVVIFETTIEPATEGATMEPPTPKPKRPPRKKKEKETPDPTPPPIENVSPPTPETEHPAEEIKIPPPKAKAKPRAKPKAKQVQTTPNFPTHDDEGQRIRPPPSLERPTRPETAEEFWNATLKNMKEKKTGNTPH